MGMLDATTLLAEVAGAGVNGPSDAGLGWPPIDWRQAEDTVRRLRQRIFTASKAGDLKKVRNLQKLMLRSRANAVLSVRRVTEINAGRMTAGIDGRLALHPEDKAALADWIQHHARPWTPRPVKRVYISKANGRRRPLGIPVIADRALQALTVNALEPEWEARFEPRSYGFRPGRSCHDAIAAIYNTASGKTAKRLWVLDADLASAFDQLDHAHLLDQLGGFPGRGLVAAWLRAGVLERGRFTPTERGSPQGGVISPLLLNVALHGMEQATGVRYYPGAPTRETVRGVPVLVRYADDLLALCHTQAQAEQVKARLAAWLAPRGLAFNDDKTAIRHLDADGCDFLGYSIRRYRGKLLIKPSTAAMRRIRETAHRRGQGAARRQRPRGDHHAQPDHPRVGGLLPERGLQQSVRPTGRPSVAADLQVGQPPPREQAEALGHRPLLRPVPPVPAGPLGLRRPRQRRLPGQVLLDKDRPAHPGQRRRLTRRPDAGRILGTAASPKPAPAGPRHPAPARRAAGPLPDLPRTAPARRRRTTRPRPMATVVHRHPQSDPPPGDPGGCTLQPGRYRRSPPDTRPLPTTRTGNGPAPCNASPAIKACLSRVRLAPHARF